MEQQKIRVAISGGAGYTAGELLRLLVAHPLAEVVAVQSTSHAGAAVGSVHTDLVWWQKEFVESIDFDAVDVVFLCMGHGHSLEFFANNDVPEIVKVIDLGNDFRLAADANGFIYGLPELRREQIRECSRLANPGCFATSIELALLPLAAAGLLPDEVTVVAMTGSTGAGQKPTHDTHFSNRSGNLSNYKVFTHQHLAEIGETLDAAGSQTDLAFVPVRGCHTRGIMADVVLRTEMSEEEVRTLYKNFYADAPFTFVSDKPVYMKQVVGTNYCMISVQKEGDKLLITSVIDNLLKGASGQAVQNMNLMFGIDEMCGLRLKAVGF